MTWASISLRKMELKNRINSLESQLIDISQQIQTIANKGAARETQASLWSNYNLTLINNQYMTNMQLAQNTNWNAVSAINSCTSAEDIQKYIDKYKEETGNSDFTLNLDTYDTTTVEGLAEAKQALINAIPETALFAAHAALGETNGTVFGDVSINSNYYSANAAATISYNNQKLALDTQTQAQSNVLRGETDSQTQALEAQQEQIQTQLKAARAEYENLDQALDNDISKGAIKLV